MKLSDTRTIELTRKQYRALLKAVYLGNWMANSQRIGDKENPKIKDYESISHHMFSLAPEFGFKDYVAHEESDGASYYPTGFFERDTDVEELREEYDDEEFSSEFCDQLAQRDFVRSARAGEIKNMNASEREKEFSKLVNEYDREFMTNGLGRFEIKKDDK